MDDFYLIDHGYTFDVGYYRKTLRQCGLPICDIEIDDFEEDGTVWLAYISFVRKGGAFFRVEYWFNYVDEVEAFCREIYTKMGCIPLED